MSKVLIAAGAVAALAVAGLVGASVGGSDSEPAPAPTTTTTAPAPTTTTTLPAPTTTTTTVDVSAIQQELEDSCYGEVWDGMKDLSDSATALASSRDRSAIATARGVIPTMQDSVDVCRGIVSPGMTGAMQDLTDATSDLIELYADGISA